MLLEDDAEDHLVLEGIGESPEDVALPKSGSLFASLPRHRGLKYVVICRYYLVLNAMRPRLKADIGVCK